MTIKKANKGKVGNTHDKVYTPPHIAKLIINSLPIERNSTILEPCLGKGAFFNNFPPGCYADWCEIDKGRDFFDFNDMVDWIITNPPYSIFDAFVRHCFEVSENVVLLVPAIKLTSSIGRIKLLRSYGKPVSLFFYLLLCADFHSVFHAPLFGFKRDIPAKQP
jgi:hypothetical protein